MGMGLGNTPKGSSIIKFRKIGTFVIAVAIIGLIFSPFPGIDAVTILVTDPTFSTADPLDFKIIVRDDTITFPTGDLVNSDGFNSPHAVESNQDVDGHIWVSDELNNRVLHFSTPSTDFSEADIVIGQPDFKANGVNQGGAVAANTLSGPTDICEDGNSLFVVDSGNNRVLRFTAPFTNNMNADLVIGQDSFETSGASSAADGLARPLGVECAENDDLIVGDTDNNRVLIYDFPLTNGEDAVVALGQQSLTTNNENDGSLSSSSLLFPEAIHLVLGDVEDLWVADTGNNRVLKFPNVVTLSTGDAATVVLGQPGFGTNGVNQGGLSASTLSEPIYVEEDPGSSKLWVADSGNNRVLRYAATSSLSSGDPAVVVLGQPGFETNGVNQGGLSASTLNFPTGILNVDATDDLFVADLGNNRVLKYLAPISNGEAAVVVLGQDTFTTNFVNGPLTSETLLATNIIRVTTDLGTINEKIAFFNLDGTKVSGDSTVIGTLSFNGAVREPTPFGPSGSFNYGYGYGYGYGFFSGLYGYGTIGSGTYGYGLTTNVFNQDVAGLYSLTLLGNPTSIRIDVLENTDSTDFFTSDITSVAAGFGAGDVIETAVTFDTPGTISGGTFQDVVTFDVAQTFEGSTVFSGGFDANIDLDFGTSTNTFDKVITFDANAIFGAIQIWSATAIVTFGDALADVFSFSAVQDFSQATIDFIGAMTFTATPIFAPDQSFDGSMTFTGLSADNMETMMGSDKNLQFRGAVTFPPVPIDFPLGTEFDTPFTIPAASTFAAGVALPPLQSFPTGLTFSPGVFFGATPTFADITDLVAGMVIPADAIFTPGQIPPANLMLGSGLVLTPIACLDAACALPAANILSPGEFFSLPASITVKQGIESSNLNSPTTISIPGAGLLLGLTPTSTGSLSLDILGTGAFSALGATAAANGQATFSSAGSSITTVSPILDPDISDLVDPGTAPTLELTYDESNFPSGTSESNAVIFVFTGGVWQQATGCIVNTGANTVTCTLPAGSLD